ncbi:hypothetical protein EAH76_07470 [Sphingomonas glacialis]|uniref:Uncharacterized protein n=1 Tax=Sphingomonas glacialis TaxID=658225 RepID=A0A502FZK4_9SPHN|nr:hypothetical protein EAH76_07470 [Sphingomonas glacialis]
MAGAIAAAAPKRSIDAVPRRGQRHDFAEFYFRRALGRDDTGAVHSRCRGRTARAFHADRVAPSVAVTDSGGVGAYAAAFPVPHQGRHRDVALEVKRFL